LKSNKPIKTYANNWGTIYNRVDICNKKLIAQLEKLGIVFRKTFKIRFPTYLDDCLVKHFIRGYFDGDGCLTITKTRNKALVSITSNESFCEQLKVHIEKRVNIHCLINPVYSDKCDVQIKRTVVSGNKQILTFLDWLYGDANIYLERKYQKYIQLKNDPISSKKVKLEQLDVVNPITIPAECI
jgi:intein-encoded DNA endonuclease-like protein